MAPTWHCKRCPLCPVQFAVIPSWGIPSVSSLTLDLSRNPRLFFSKCQERLKERCATQIVVRILENSGHWHASTNSISLVGNYESFTTIIAILTHFTSKMDVKHFGNLLLAKIYCTIMGAGASHHDSVGPKQQIRKYWIYCLWHAAQA